MPMTRAALLRAQLQAVLALAKTEGSVAFAREVESVAEQTIQFLDDLKNLAA